MLEQVELIRLTLDKDQPTIGMMLFNGYPELITLELPDKDNQRQVSCIPEGMYVCTRVHDRNTSGGMQIKTTFEVLAVPGREGILFHVGNSCADTMGCILTGLKLGGQLPDLGISESRIAFQKFLKLTASWNSFELHISHA